MLHNRPVNLANNECFCDSYETRLDAVIQTDDLEEAARRAAEEFFGKFADAFQPPVEQHVAVERGDGKSRNYQVTKIGERFEITDRSH